MSDIGGPADDGGIQGRRRPFGAVRPTGWKRRSHRTNEAKRHAQRWPRWMQWGAPMSAWCCSKAGTKTAVFLFSTRRSAKGGRDLLPSPCRALPALEIALHARRSASAAPSPKSPPEEGRRLFRASRARDQPDRRLGLGPIAPMESRFALSKRRSPNARVQYRPGKQVPRPAYWTGLRLAPVRDRILARPSFRLHDRLVYRRANPAAPWTSEQAAVSLERRRQMHMRRRGPGLAWPCRCSWWA